MKTFSCAVALLVFLCVPRAIADEPWTDPDAIPEAERNALLWLFETTNGSQWVNREGWRGPVGSECEWFGVGCGYSLSGGHPTVEGLSLGENGLSGKLPTNLGDLTNLTELLLYGNRLTGSVPESVLQRFDEGRLRFLGYAGQFSSVVEVHLEVSPVAVICGDYEVKLRAGGPDTLARKVCRNAKKGDRATFWERSSSRAGTVYVEEIDRLARMIDTLGFSALAPSYSRNITHGRFERLTVVYRDGTRKTVQDYADSAPAPVWLIKRVIAGIAFDAEWEKTTRSKPVVE